MTVNIAAEVDYDQDDEDEEDEDYMEEDEDLIEDEEISPRKGKMKMINAIPETRGNFCVAAVAKVM
jgi:hypothetical protein